MHFASEIWSSRWVTLVGTLVGVCLSLGGCQNAEQSYGWNLQNDRPENGPTPDADVGSGGPPVENDAGSLDIDSGTPPPVRRLDLPDSVEIPKTEAGEESTSQFTVTNPTESPVTITNLSMSVSSQDEIRELFFPDGFTDARTLGPGEKQTFEVTYEPENGTSDSGTIRLTTETSTYELPVVTSVVHPTVEAPRRLRFGHRTPDGTVSRFVEIWNSGTDPLDIDSIVLQGSDQFRVRYYRKSSAGSVPSPGNDLGSLNELPESESWSDADAPDTLAPGEGVQVGLWFLHMGPGTINAELRILSNDPDAPVETVDLLAKGEEPCLTLEPRNRLEFAATRPDESRTRTLEVSNCGWKPVSIDAVQIRGPAARRFAIVTPQSELSSDVAPGATRPIRVRFSSESAANRRARIGISTDAGTQVSSTLTGSGGDFSCPQAVIQSDSGGTQTILSRRATQRPSVTLTLSGVAEGAGSIDTYNWSVLKKPEGATITFEPSASDPTPTVSPDRPGTYIVGFDNTDTDYVSGCPEWSRVQLNLDQTRLVESMDRSFVLTWTPAGDGTPSLSAGADVDLHALNISRGPGGWEGVHDVYWGNPSQEYRSNDRLMTISLTRDDRNGAGPEIINITDPLAGEMFSVAGYVWAYEGRDQLLLAARYFEGNQLHHEVTRTISAPDYFWHAFDLEFLADGFRIATRDETAQTFQ